MTIVGKKTEWDVPFCFDLNYDVAGQVADGGESSSCFIKFYVMISWLGFCRFLRMRETSVVYFLTHSDIYFWIISFWFSSNRPCDHLLWWSRFLESTRPIASELCYFKLIRTSVWHFLLLNLLWTANISRWCAARDTDETRQKSGPK